MNPPRPTTLIIHNAPQRTLLHWNWLLWLNANESTSTVELVFSGLKVLITTTKPFELLEAINDGKVHRIRIAPIKAPAPTDFVVDAVTFTAEDDE